MRSPEAAEPEGVALDVVAADPEAPPPLKAAAGGALASKPAEKGVPEALNRSRPMP